MVFFALTFYCYGVAIYTAPVLLFVFALWCLATKQLSIKEIIFSIMVFGIVALPEALVMVINMFHLKTIETTFFTLPFFPESVRSDDILFMNFSFAQLGKNALSMLTHVFIQTPDYIFNTIPFFGPLYHISIPFMLLGIFVVVRSFFTEKETLLRTKHIALIGFLLSGIWVGLITKEVNVNRINIIFYPLIIFTGIGVNSACEFTKNKFNKSFKTITVCLYIAVATLFFISYGTYYKESIKPWFSVNFMDAVLVADSIEGIDSLYITTSM
jgi:hypothetical protein